MLSARLVPIQRSKTRISPLGSGRFFNHFGRSPVQENSFIETDNAFDAHQIRRRSADSTSSFMIQTLYYEHSNGGHPDKPGAHVPDCGSNLTKREGSLSFRGCTSRYNSVSKHLEEASACSCTPAFLFRTQ